MAKMFTDNIVMLPERPGNRMESIVDTTRVEQEFGWTTEHMVKEYIESLKQMKKDPSKS